MSYGKLNDININKCAFKQTLNKAVDSIALNILSCMLRLHAENFSNIIKQRITQAPWCAFPLSRW